MGGGHGRQRPSNSLYSKLTGLTSPGRTTERVHARHTEGFVQSPSEATQRFGVHFSGWQEISPTSSGSCRKPYGQATTGHDSQSLSITSCCVYRIENIHFNRPLSYSRWTLTNPGCQFPRGFLPPGVFSNSGVRGQPRITGWQAFQVRAQFTAWHKVRLTAPRG